MVSFVEKKFTGHVKRLNLTCEAEIVLNLNGQQYYLKKCLIEKKELLLAPFSRLVETNENLTEFKREHNEMTLEKAREYISLIEQFLHLPLFEKKRYLRNRAPDSFIDILREVLCNVRNGIVPCDESSMKMCWRGYCYVRLVQKTVGHNEARRHLYQSRTLDPLLRVLPFVLKYLHSLIK